eukprot:g17878.t1
MRRIEEAAGISAAGGEPAPLPSLKKSCDFCIRRKRHCDGFDEGKGVHGRCSLCIAKKRPECHYSLRSPMPRRASTRTPPRRRRRNDAADAADGLTFPRVEGEEVAKAKRSKSPSSQLEAAAARRSAAEALLRLATAPERVTFCASPATGLVGTKENVFLAEFFGCYGFWPLTTQSDVRGTMVGIMSSPHAVLCSPSSDRTLLLPATCSFWCAVAIGALVRGFPVDSVAGYFQRARDVLASYKGPGNVEVIKAVVLLAYLHGSIGDTKTFYSYLELSEKFLRDSVDRGDSAPELPMGFDEIILYGHTAKFYNDDIAPEQAESLIAEEITLPQIGEIATEREIFRFVLEYCRALEQNAYIKRMAGVREATSLEDGVDDADISSGAAYSRPAAPRRLIEACLNKVHNIQFEQLEPAVQRPSIQMGSGGLIINAMLSCQKLVKGDIHGTLERIGRCVEVLERFPGLLRFHMASHCAHILLSITAATSGPVARDFYGKIRHAYNRMAPCGSVLVPALDAWEGVSTFCDKVQCGIMELILASQREAEAL